MNQTLAFREDRLLGKVELPLPDYRSILACYQTLRTANCHIELDCLSISGCHSSPRYKKSRIQTWPHLDGVCGSIEIMLGRVGAAVVQCRTALVPKSHKKLWATCPHSRMGKRTSKARPARAANSLFRVIARCRAVIELQRDC